MTASAALITLLADQPPDPRYRVTCPGDPNRQAVIWPRLVMAYAVGQITAREEQEIGMIRASHR